jgi:hypothetical protein
VIACSGLLTLPTNITKPSAAAGGNKRHMPIAGASQHAEHTLQSDCACVLLLRLKSKPAAASAANHQRVTFHHSRAVYYVTQKVSSYPSQGPG